MWRPRKLWAAFLAVLAVAVPLTSCGGGEEPAPAPTPTQVAVAPTATAAPAIQPTPTRPPAVVVPTPTVVAPRPTPAVAEQPRRGGTLRVWGTRAPEGLDLHRQRSSSNWFMMVPQINWLIEVYQRKGTIKPDLAERWEISPDGKTYTFYLNKAARWHDGQPVTTQDVLFSYEKVALDKAGYVSVWKYMYEPVESVRVVDTSTFQFTLKQRSASFLANLGAFGGAVYPQHYPTANYAAVKPMGSGPFKFKAYDGGTRFELVRNDNYFKPGLPYLDGIDFFIIPEATTGYAAFRTNRLDVSFGLDAAPLFGKVEQVQKDVPGVQLLKNASSWTGVVFYNRPPYDNITLRKAFNLIFDRHEVVALTTLGVGTPYMMYSPPKEEGSVFAVPQETIAKLPGYAKDKSQEWEEARRLLGQAGVSPSTFRIDAQVRNIYERYATVAIEQLRRFGFTKVSLRVEDSPTTVQTQLKGTFDVMVWNNVTALDDPSSTIAPFFASPPRGAQNWGRWFDPKIDALLDEIDTTLDLPKRVQLSHQLELYIFDQAYQLPIGNNAYYWAIRPNVRNYIGILHSQDGPGLRYEDVWLAP